LAPSLEGFPAFPANRVFSRKIANLALDRHFKVKIYKQIQWLVINFPVEESREAAARCRDFPSLSRD
jgi:hypothetical protein